MADGRKRTTNSQRPPKDKGRSLAMDCFKRTVDGLELTADGPTDSGWLQAYGRWWTAPESRRRMASWALDGSKWTVDNPWRIVNGPLGMDLRRFSLVDGHLPSSKAVFYGRPLSFKDLRCMPRPSSMAVHCPLSSIRASVHWHSLLATLSMVSYWC